MPREKVHQLSAESLARLNRQNDMSDVESGTLRKPRGHHHRDSGQRHKHHRISGAPAPLAEKRPHHPRRRSSRVVVAGRNKSRRRFPICCLIGVVIFVLLIAVLVPVGVVVIGKKNNSSNGSNSSDSKGSNNSNGKGGGDNLNNVNPDSVPTDAKGTLLDPFTWKDTTDFNLTFTRATVGGLSIMGLNTTWDDTTKANPTVPALNEPWDYSTRPMRGVNIGGWLVLEPFITPSMFDSYDIKLGIVDEYTLSQHLGESGAESTLETHYSTFVNEKTFADIAAAGLDHVRIPYPYWAVTTLPGDTFVKGVCWRYLLRGIEWARKHGLRVDLDLHSVPGNANGWNHSGRLQAIGWLNGTDGDVNAELTLQLHQQLATFFSQPRYKNIITFYGLVNEPRMIVLPIDKVLNWTETAHDIIRKAGYNGVIVFGDGFRGLENWKGAMPGFDNMALDVHQYVIFNVGQIGQTHTGKIQFACSGWSAQMSQSINPSTGYGPTLVGEWGQADTDCARYLNNVGVGARWDGTLNNGDPASSQLVPACAAHIQNLGTCTCDGANATPDKWSATYKQFLLMFAQAQMDSFEIGYGWVYWTWDTEDTHQWSYKKGMAAGVLPKLAYERDWHCNNTIPDFGILGLLETY